jgi:hypothetical protein
LACFPLGVTATSSFGGRVTGHAPRKLILVRW